MFSLTAILIYILIGITAGFNSGLFGVGGGILVVPLLSYVLEFSGVHHNYIMHITAATSLSVMLLTTATSAYKHAKKTKVKWPIYKRLLPAIVIGVVSGVLLADKLPSVAIRILFGLFVIFIGFDMLFVRAPKRIRHLPGTFGMSCVGWIIGFKSGLFGIGGGSITIPFLTRCNVPMRDAVALSAQVSFTIAVLGTMTSLLTGANEIGLPPYCIGYILWPAAIMIAIPSMLFVPLGVKVSHWLSTRRLKQIFAILLLLIGLNMLWR